MLKSEQMRDVFYLYVKSRSSSKVTKFHFNPTLEVPSHHLPITDDNEKP